MKKILALLLALVMILGLCACGSNEKPETPSESPAASQPAEQSPEPSQPAESQPVESAPVESEPAEVTVMSYDEYIAAPLDTPVVVETYVQAKQSWWDNKATVYTQDEDGAYFCYDMACSEEDYAKLTVGTKIRVTGYKGEWAGEVEIMDATFEIIEGSFIASPVNATHWLGTDELIAHQNEFVTFTDMVVEPSVDAAGNEVAFLYGWDGSGSPDSDSDLYFNVSSNGQTYNFVVEYYVCDAAGNYGSYTDVYKTVQGLQIGDVIDLEGFLYWYEGANPHITAVVPAAQTKSEGVMTYAEYIAAPLDSQVVVETYVQGKQSWWDNKATVYTQDKDGAYFCYDMACSEEDYAKLTVGTKIRVTGYKGEWAGEVEIMDATFEILDGRYVAPVVDATGWLNTDELIAHQNELAVFKGMTVESIEYKNGEPGDDIYVTLSKDGVSYSFCVEVYLTGPETEVYQTVGTLAAGDVVDVTGFIYWYEGVNTHIIDVTAAN